MGELGREAQSHTVGQDFEKWKKVLTQQAHWSVFIHTRHFRAKLCESEMVPFNELRMLPLQDELKFRWENQYRVRLM